MRFLTLILCCIGQLIFGQQDNESLKDLAKEQAQLVLNATIDQDYKTILQYTHPLIVEKSGKNKLRNVIKEIFTAMQASQISITESEVIEVSNVIKEQNEQRCLVKNKIKMNLPNQKIIVQSSMIGFYQTNPDQWVFIEAAKLNNDPETKLLFPNFKTGLSIPEDTQTIVN